MIKYFILLLSACCLAAAQQCAETTVKPKPSVGKYHVNVANTTRPCLVAQMSAYITLGQGHYLSLDNGTVNTNSSQCGSATEDAKLVLKFDCGLLGFTISHQNDSTVTFVKSIAGHYNISNQSVDFLNVTQLFNTTQSGHYYKCNAEQIVGNTNQNSTLVLSNFAYEAYRDVPGTDFYGVPEECPLDAQPVSDLVRVAVGICLIALVAIVLVAYFIGRRRWSERSSYESV